MTLRIRCEKQRAQPALSDQAGWSICSVRSLRDRSPVGQALLEIRFLNALICHDHAADRIAKTAAFLVVDDDRRGGIAAPALQLCVHGPTLGALEPIQVRGNLPVV